MTAINLGMPRHKGDNWEDKAECRKHDPELWWPQEGLKGRFRAERAKEICLKECPVRDECLQANMHEEYGIVGGLDEQERRKLRNGMQSRA